MTTEIERVQALRRTVAAGRERAVRAQTTKEQAEQSLAALLAEHGCTTIEELNTKAAQAQQAAQDMLAAAEAAISA